MSPETLFQIHLVLGYVAWLLCFGVYVLPRLKSMDRFEAQRVIATLHSFRFFGLVFILRRLWRLRDRGARHAGAAHDQDTSGLLAVRRRLQSRGDYRPNLRLLPRYPGRPSSVGGAIRRHVRDPDHLCASADDYALRRVLFAAASSVPGGSCPRRRRGRILK